MKPKVEFRKVRDFGEIISDCILFIRQEWKGLLKTYFTFCGLFIAGNMLFSLLFRLKLIHLHNANLSGNSFSTGSVFGLEYFMVLIFGFLNIISATLTVLCYITLYNEKGRQTPGINEIWAYYKYYFWRIVGHTLLLTIIIFLGLFAIVLPLAYALRGAEAFFLGIIILVCVMAPLIYFATVFSLFFPIVVTENAGFGYALSKCFTLIKRKWWNTFGVLLVVGLIVYAGFLVIIIPFSIISGGGITFLSYNVSFPIVIVYTILFSLCQVYNILPLCASSIAYFSYSEDKESTGLLERIDTLGKPDETFEPGNETY